MSNLAKGNGGADDTYYATSQQRVFSYFSFVLNKLSNFKNGRCSGRNNGKWTLEPVFIPSALTSLKRCWKGAAG
jgi:hypothetical protein